MAGLQSDARSSHDIARSTLSAAFVRQSSQVMLEHARAGRLESLALDETRMDAVVDYVIATTRINYPALDIPFHARWRHFYAGGRNLWAELDAGIEWSSSQERIRAAYDLVIVSVLLDAGAGMSWRFTEPVTGTVTSKSEGLGLASLTMFRAGLFSADPARPLRVDAARLMTLSADDLRRGFQAGDENLMVGLEGRTRLLHRLGQHLAGLNADPDQQRPGHIADVLVDIATKNERAIEASIILFWVLKLFGPIWPQRKGALKGCGDVWFHRHGAALGGWPHVVAFHKLSQWLSYSLIEPLMSAGYAVTHIDGLTGLPEYRNGGLFLDMGVLSLKNPADWSRPHEVGSPLIIEWRALTVALLDIVAEKMRAKLGLSAEQLPLAKVLEGGTWSAGRRIAKETRADGSPPLTVISDGTVF